MNPFDHARSSARRHGGTWQDYIPIHAWIDSSKITYCLFKHRAIHHHVEGAREATKVFGATILNSDGIAVTVHDIAAQHISEDCGFVPVAADWLVDYDVPDWLPDPVMTAHSLAAISARHFGGSPEHYRPLHEWFLETADWVPGHRHLFFRHNSFGLFEAESRWGPALFLPDGRTVPTRVIAERHVRTMLGRIPSATEMLRRISGRKWMLQATSAEKLGLDEPRAPTDRSKEGMELQAA